MKKYLSQEKMKTLRANTKLYKQQEWDKQDCQYERYRLHFASGHS